MIAYKVIHKVDTSRTISSNNHILISFISIHVLLLLLLCAAVFSHHHHHRKVHPFFAGNQVEQNNVVNVFF